jgi:hypothetical protein
MREGNRFMMMARRLTSYIDLRNVAPEYRSNPCSFIIADDKAIAFRQQASRWDGIVEFDDIRSSSATSPTSTRSGQEPDPARDAGHGRSISERRCKSRPARPLLKQHPDALV